MIILGTKELVGEHGVPFVLKLALNVRRYLLIINNIIIIVPVTMSIFNTMSLSLLLVKVFESVLKVDDTMY